MISFIDDGGTGPNRLQPVPRSGESVQVNVTNLTQDEARLLRRVVSLFCDPAKAPALEHLRQGLAKGGAK